MRGLDFDDGQGVGRALIGALAADDALEGLCPVGMVEHCPIRTKANAGKATHAQLFPQADDALLVPVEGVGGADVNTVAALVTKDGAEGDLAVTLFVDTNTRLFRIGDFEPGIGADLFAGMAADAEFWIVRQDFHSVLSLNVVAS